MDDGKLNLTVNSNKNYEIDKQHMCFFFSRSYIGVKYIKLRAGLCLGFSYTIRCIDTWLRTHFYERQAKLYKRMFSRSLIQCIECNSEGNITTSVKQNFQFLQKKIQKNCCILREKDNRKESSVVNSQWHQKVVLETNFNQIYLRV